MLKFSSPRFPLFSEKRSLRGMAVKNPSPFLVTSSILSEKFFSGPRLFSSSPSFPPFFFFPFFWRKWISMGARTQCEGSVKAFAFINLILLSSFLRSFSEGWPEENVETSHLFLSSPPLFFFLFFFSSFSSLNNRKDCWFGAGRFPSYFIPSLPPLSLSIGMMEKRVWEAA